MYENYEDLISQLVIGYSAKDSELNILSFVDDAINDEETFGMTSEDIAVDVVVALYERERLEKKAEKVSAFIEASTVLEEIPEGYNIVVTAGTAVKVWEAIVKNAPGLCRMIRNSVKQLKKKLAFIEAKLEEYKKLIKLDKIKTAQRIIVDILKIIFGKIPGKTLLKLAAKFNLAFGKMIVKSIKWLLTRKIKGETEGLAKVCEQYAQ